MSLRALLRPPLRALIRPFKGLVKAPMDLDEALQILDKAPGSLNRGGEIVADYYIRQCDRWTGTPRGRARSKARGSRGASNSKWGPL